MHIHTYIYFMFLMASWRISTQSGWQIIKHVKSYMSGVVFYSVQCVFAFEAPSPPHPAFVVVANHLIPFFFWFCTCFSSPSLPTIFSTSFLHFHHSSMATETVASDHSAPSQVCVYALSSFDFVQFHRLDAFCVLANCIFRFSYLD